MKLILFDVDLTLIDTAGAGRRAMTRAFEDLFGHKNGMNEVSFAGRTDPAIFRDAISQCGLKWKQASLEHFKSVYLKYLHEEIKVPDSKKHVKPGILQLLNELSNRTDVVLGLLTGNWREGAKIKLSHFELDRFFEIGAFGDDSEDRNELPSFAVERFVEIHQRRINPKDIVIIGDTPLDIACARSFGATSVAVATGFFSHADLQEWHPDFLFPDLSNGSSFLRMVDGS